MLIGILADGLGDALAEPVGIAFGKHRYRAKSFFSTRTQSRILEGNACVFASAVMAILLVNDVFLPVGFWLALLTIPLLVTAVESLVTTYMGRPVSLSDVGLWQHLCSRCLQTDSLTRARETDISAGTETPCC